MEHWGEDPGLPCTGWQEEGLGLSPCFGDLGSLPAPLEGTITRIMAFASIFIRFEVSVPPVCHGMDFKSGKNARKRYCAEMLRMLAFASVFPFPPEGKTLANTSGGENASKHPHLLPHPPNASLH